MGEGPRGFLWQVVSHSAADRPVLVFSGELPGVGDGDCKTPPGIPGVSYSQWLLAREVLAGESPEWIAANLAATRSKVSVGEEQRENVLIVRDPQAYANEHRKLNPICIHPQVGRVGLGEGIRHDVLRAQEDLQQSRVSRSRNPPGRCGVGLLSRMREPDIQPGTTSTHERASSDIRLAVANDVSIASSDASLPKKSS